MQVSRSTGYLFSPGVLWSTQLLNLHDSWEWGTREERKMLVCTMLQEVGCDVGTKRIVWVKVNPDYEILFSLMDGWNPTPGDAIGSENKALKWTLLTQGKRWDRWRRKSKSPF